MQWYAIDGRPISVWHQSKAGVGVEGNSLVVVQGADVSWPSQGPELY